MALWWYHLTCRTLVCSSAIFGVPSANRSPCREHEFTCQLPSNLACIFIDKSLAFHMSSDESNWLAKLFVIPISIFRRIVGIFGGPRYDFTYIRQIRWYSVDLKWHSYCSFVDAVSKNRSPKILLVVSPLKFQCRFVTFHSNFICPHVTTSTSSIRTPIQIHRDQYLCYRCSRNDSDGFWSRNEECDTCSFPWCRIKLLMFSFHPIGQKAGCVSTATDSLLITIPMYTKNLL